MAFKDFFSPSSRLESLIEKIQQQKSNIFISGTRRAVGQSVVLIGEGSFN